MNKETPVWNLVELTFRSERQYENPYADVDLVVTFHSPAGDSQRAWGFWDGGATWKVRFAPSVEGRWEWRSLYWLGRQHNLRGSGLFGNAWRRGNLWLCSHCL